MSLSLRRRTAASTTPSRNLFLLIHHHGPLIKLSIFGNIFEVTTRCVDLHPVGMGAFGLMYPLRFVPHRACTISMSTVSK
ncbi:hypothetical protein EHS25_007143 [Saitozyma podzolica]|uniref:Uncharacterized protein n=1 Tax=Saitozyma podzolica TaxID=1890683 RepID=A0A427XPA9_9TREE|nr:hypothetical protein EHS25_007143 [Saitozyma podzolica]